MNDLNSFIDKKWHGFLNPLFQKHKINHLFDFIDEQRSKNKIIFPANEFIFSAFNFCPPEKLKIVIIGQDPYHGDGQANGLCFSVNKNTKIPPSLRNIFIEIKNDLFPNIDKEKTMFEHGDLCFWAKQGVLLLNSCLSVEKNKPASHSKIGWQELTDDIIHELSQQHSNIVFMLWGNYAKSKTHLIDQSKHLVLSAAHPSPFSVKNYFGCKHFSLANKYLCGKNKKKINWTQGND